MWVNSHTMTKENLVPKNEALVPHVPNVRQVTTLPHYVIIFYDVKSTTAFCYKTGLFIKPKEKSINFNNTKIGDEDK